MLLSSLSFIAHLGRLKLDYSNKELLILKYSTCQLFIELLRSISSMKSGKGLTFIHIFYRHWLPTNLMSLSQLSLYFFVKQVKNIFNAKTGLSIQFNPKVSKKEGSHHLFSLFKLCACTGTSS